MRFPARILGVIGLTLAALPAAAQPVAEAQESGGWLAFMVMIGLVVLIAIGSFMSSRRGHQD
ncbi:MAG: hypothetical protein AAF800_12045 [Planctomycetota bacterium]